MSASPAAGFADPVLGAQSTFRAVLDAFAEPGRIVREAGAGLAPPAPLHRASFALSLTLLDFETPVWLDPNLDAAPVRNALRFHCGCPLVSEPEAAAFALIGSPSEMPPLERFAVGTSDYPDRGATLVLQVERLEEVGGLTLAGPGIRGSRQLDAAPLPPGFDARWAANRALYPQGLDLVLVAGDRLAALPRSVCMAG